jgi:hypothetical protein
VSFVAEGQRLFRRIGSGREQSRSQNDEPHPHRTLHKSCQGHYTMPKNTTLPEASFRKLREYYA